MAEVFEENQVDVLPFSEKKQDAMLGHLLLNPRFFQQARNKILPEWFVNVHAGKVYGAKCNFYNKYNQRIPSIDELKECQDFLREDPATRNKLVSRITQACMEAENFGLDALSEELTQWMHARIYQKGVTKSVDLYHRRQFSEAYSLLHKDLEEIKATRFDEDFEERFENYAQEFEDRQVERKGALTFGFSMLDNLLLPDTPAGSLLPGDTTVLLAPTNVGKTTTMITVACHNIRRAKHVLLITHEGSPADIKDKIWCSLLRVNKPTLYTMHRTPEGRARLDAALAFIKKYLTYVPLNKAGLTVEQVEPLIRRRQEERMARNKGQGYHLLIDDYPAKLMTELAKGGQFSRRHIDEIVYNYFVQFGLEYKFHSLLAIQTNRTGSKVNQGQEDDGRLLSMEDVAESWGPMTAATNVISINRDKLAEAKNRVTFYVCKSRSSATGYAVVCNSNYECAVTHDNEYGGIWYRGASNMADTVDFLLSENKANPFKNGEVPTEKVPF